jgi:PadR family transcriptional regulator
MKFLSRQEELLLLSIWSLGDSAYGIPIREHVSKVSERYWSIGAVYDVLDRLVRKGLVTTMIGAPVKARGGKSRRYYRITKSGFRSLRELTSLQERAWSGMPKTALAGKESS